MVPLLAAVILEVFPSGKFAVTVSWAVVVFVVRLVVGAVRVSDSGMGSTDPKSKRPLTKTVPLGATVNRSD